jgi:hypothetical protein
MTTNHPFFDDETYGSYQILEGQYLLKQIVQREYLEIPCKGIKVRFLNQYGTYSEWYFNNYEINKTTKHTDVIEKFTTIWNGEIFKDIGSKVEKSITVKDAVPRRYNELMDHLIISRDIHIFEDGFYRKVILTNSKWYENSRENTFRHSIKFDYPNVLNPTDLC